MVLETMLNDRVMAATAVTAVAITSLFAGVRGLTKGTHVGKQLMNPSNWFIGAIGAETLAAYASGAASTTNEVAIYGGVLAAGAVGIPVAIAAVRSAFTEHGLGETLGSLSDGYQDEVQGRLPIRNMLKNASIVGLLAAPYIAGGLSRAYTHFAR